MGNALVLVLGLAVAGCSSGDIFGRSNSSSSSPSFGDRISNMFNSQPAQPQVQAPNAPVITADDIECPTVVIRQGASTYAQSAIGVDPSVMTLRFQATFVRYARECKVTPTTLSMRVGVEGRVILGPAGGPGTVEIPLRFAIVQEGPEPKTITTKLRWFPVTIAPGETNVAFTQVEDDLSFPMPRADELGAYVAYIGFDQAAVKGLERKGPAKKPAPVAKKKP